MLGTAQDITDRKRIDELRDSILTTVSHELRTPLTAILGFSMTLEEKGDRLDEETRAEMVRNLSQQSRKLDRLLSDLLDIDRLRRGFVPPNFHETDVGQLVEHVATAFSPGSHVIEVHAEVSRRRSMRRSGADRRQPDRERRQPHASGHRDLGTGRGEQRWRADHGGRQRSRRCRVRPESIFDLFTRGAGMNPCRAPASASRSSRSSRRCTEAACGSRRLLAEAHRFVYFSRYGIR